MEINVIKKESDDIEDAEIIVSENMKYNNKVIYKLKLQFFFLFAAFFVLLFIIFGFFMFHERKLSEEILELRTKIESLSPIISLETIETKFSDFEVVTRQEYTNRIDQAVKNIEIIFNKKIKSLSDVTNNNNIIKVIEDDLSTLKLKLEKDLNDVKMLANERTKNHNTKVVRDEALQSQVDLLNADLNNTIDNLTKRLNELEQKFLIPQRKLNNLNDSIEVDINQNVVLDVVSLAELKEAFPKIAYAALKLEAKNNIGGSPWSLFYSTLKSMFIFRSTVPKEGFNTDAILSRAEHELAKGNFDGCLRELTFLEDDLADLFFEWKNNLSNIINKTN